MIFIAGCWFFLGDVVYFGALKPSVFILLGVAFLSSLLAANNNGHRFVMNAITEALYNNKSKA